MATGDCNKIACGEGYLDLETLLLGLFAKDASGCVGIKMFQLTETDCANLTPAVNCGEVLTVEQAFKMAIVDDGCGGWALGYYAVADAPQ